MPITLDKDSADQIVGGTDGTIIGNVNDRLKVIGQSDLIPGTIVQHSFATLLNGASSNMAVNGSTTPVVFSAGPASGKTWYINSIGFEFSDTGATKSADYGGINLGLTNGFLIEQVINTTNYAVANLKSNREIVIVFHSGAFAGGNSGFITDANFYSGLLDITPHLTLVGTAGDKIQATVRDDLTGLVEQRLIIHYWEAI